MADNSTPDSPASDKTKKANGQGRDDASFGRTTLPYVIAALLAAVAMAWLFVFVPAKLDYFVGLRFRTLAVASGHVASKVDNLARAFGSVPNSPPPRDDGSCVPQTDEQRTERARYVALVLPEVRLQSATGGPRFVACDVSGSVAWSDVAIQAAEASRRDFDDLLIADGDGDVVWQREMSTPRIGNLSELLGVTDDEGSWWSISWRERATVPAKKNVDNLRSSAVLKVVNLGGTSSLLLVQAVALTDRSITLSGDPASKTADGAQLYVAGLVSRAGLQQQARRIPAAWVVLIALPIMLLFLAIPFVKLATLTINERYRFSDVVLVILSTVAASGLGAMIPFVSAPPSAPDATLERLATAVNEGLKNETAEVLKLADVILANRPQIEAKLLPCEALGSGLQMPGTSATSGKQECGLWEALGAAVPSDPTRALAVDLDVVIWFDENGNQIRKWTTKRQVTGRTSHRPFDHYRAASTDQLWTMVGGGSPRRFMIDPLRAPTTAELGVVFVTPSPAVEGEEKSYFALNVRPQSVVDPIVPPGYGFAIIAPTGKVLFHSDEGLSLQENFFEEVGDPREVRERARANRVVHWSGDYHGRPHRFRLQPMQAFRDSPWFIITFHEVGPVLSREILQQTGAVRFGGLNLFLLVVVALLFAGYARLKHRRARDLMQTLLAEIPTATGRVWVLLVLLIVEAVTISLTYGGTAGRRLDTVYATFVGIPVAALFLVLLGGVAGSGTKRVEQPDGHTDAPAGRWDWRKIASHAELGILALLIGALPAIAFARIVHVAQETRGSEELLEAAQRQWTARQARMQERINGPNYTQALRDRLSKEFGAAEYAASGRYTYLNVLSSLNVVEDANGEPPGRYEGQDVVRRLLDSNVFSSRDEAVDAKVQREITSHVLRVQPGESAGTGDTVDGRSAQLSGIGLSLGLFILVASMSGVYWVRRKLQSHGAAAAAPSLENTIARTKEREPHPRPHASKGPVIVLLIGPARTGKDEEVHRVVQAATGAPPIERIKLLDDKETVDAAYLEKAVATVASTIHERARCVGSAQPFWIHVSNLETQLVDVASRARILKVLDRLVHGNGGQRRRLVVTSSVDPIEHFEEIFREERKGIYVNPVPEVALNRSVLILSYFRRCYMPISTHHDRRRRCRDAWDSWWHYEPKHWKDTLAAEVNGYLPLEHVREELELTWAHRKEVPFDELRRTIRARASAYYELLWTSCTRSEKLVLIQLAQEGFVTTQSADVVAPLIAKGIIVERPTPAIFNRTFRDFLVGIERNDVIQQWERGDGHGLWLVSGRLIGSSLIAGVLFFLLTQDVSVQSLLPVISGTGLFGIPLVRAILARLSGKAAESSDPGLLALPRAGAPLGLQPDSALNWKVTEAGDLPHPMLIVMKFGGTSVGSPERIAQAAALVTAARDKGHHVAAVTSAMSGVTNSLIAAAQAASKGNLDATLRQRLFDRHKTVADAVIQDASVRAHALEQIDRRLDRFEKLCYGLSMVHELTPRLLDAISGTGEMLAAPLVAGAIAARGCASSAIDATEVIVTTDQFGGAEPLMEETRTKMSAHVRPLIERGESPVLTGFIGATVDGVLTTLGRGGSDYSASIVGAALDADEIWIWTDVDGVLSANPSEVPDARTLAEIWYSEASELAYYGAKVLHYKTILPAFRQRIPVRILNSFNPTHQGTRVTVEGDPSVPGVKAVTSIRGVSLITISGTGMQGIPGIVAKAFEVVAEQQSNVLMISQASSENNMCFVITAADAPRVVKALRGTLELELARDHVEEISAQPVAVVAAIGDRMRGTPGIAATVFSALGSEGINVIAISQGSSERNISLVVAEPDAAPAIRALHRAFRLDRAAVAAK